MQIIVVIVTTVSSENVLITSRRLSVYKAHTMKKPGYVIITVVTNW